MDKRVAEASALRGFFEEQWDSLQQQLDDHFTEREASARRANEVEGAVESIVEGTDQRLRAVSGYQKILRKSARQLLEHVEAIVGDLPPAMLVSSHSLIKDPMVRRLFSSREQIRDLFHNNRAIQQFFDDPIHDTFEQVYVLLFLIRYEKNVLGSEMRGDMLVRDVRQTAVQFTAREISSPCRTEAEARSAMKKTLFDSVIAHIKRQSVAHHHGRSEEEKLAAKLNPDENIRNPEVYLQHLATELSSPCQLIKLNNDQLRIDRMGIKLPLDAPVSNDVLNLFEVEVGDEQSQIIAIVRYPRDDISE